MKTNRILTAVGAIVILTAVGVWTRLGDSGLQTVSDLERLGSIALADYDGNSVTLAEFAGKPLIINAWAVWCPFCKKELPDFAALQSEFPNIIVIAIDRAEPVEKAKGYTDELGITNSMTFLMDPDDAFYRSIGGFSMPETLFIDNQGSIVFHKRGPMTLDEMREAVQTHFQ